MSGQTAPIHAQNPSTILGQHITPSINAGLSNINTNVMFDGQQQASQYLPKNDLLINNINLKSNVSNLIGDPISTSLIAPSLASSSISNLPVYPVDGIMTEAQFYQYQERLRKERE